MQIKVIFVQKVSGALLLCFWTILEVFLRLYASLLVVRTLSFYLTRFERLAVWRVKKFTDDICEVETKSVDVETKSLQTI